MRVSLSLRSPVEWWGLSRMLSQNWLIIRMWLLRPNFVKLKFVNSSPSTRSRLRSDDVWVPTTLSRTQVTVVYVSLQGLWVIEGSSVYKGQESTYSGSEDLWWRSTELCLQPRDSEDEGWRYISMILRYRDEGSKRDLTRYSGIFEKGLVGYLQRVPRSIYLFLG